jgi:hypothetical protein
MVWPSPKPVTLTVYAGKSRLELPVRPEDPADNDLAPFEPPVSGPGTPITEFRAARPNNRTVTRNAETGETVIDQPRDGGAQLLDDIDLVIEEDGDIWHSIVEGDPLSATCWTNFVARRKRGDWSIETRTRQRLRSDETDFILEADLEAFEGDERVFSRTWNLRIPRDHL